MTDPALPQPGLRHVCNLHVAIDPVREMGRGRAGTRRIIPITGGTAEGAIAGRILHLGADWQTVMDDGRLAELDARYAVETHDGATIEIQNYGFRYAESDVLTRLLAGESVPTDAYYMRTQARLESGDPRYSWVNRTLFVGTGARRAGGVLIVLFAIE